MGTLHIPTLLEAILEATASKAAAEARIARLRAAIEDEARRRYAADGAAPSWATPRLGKVRLDPESEWAATVSDPAAFGSWVAEHFPTEATAIVPLAASDLPDALQALEFIGVKPAGDVRIEVRSAWEEQLTSRAVVDVEEDQHDDGTVDRVVTIVDPDSGLLVDGMTATRKPAKLVVSLDRDRRTAAISSAEDTAAAILEAASGEEAEGPDLDELHARRVELEGLAAGQLANIARAHQLGTSGTKAALAERIARAELATGNVIRPATELPAAPTPEPLPDDVEVEEVTTVPSDPEDPAEEDPVDVVREAVAVLEGDEGPHVDELAERRRALLDGLSREVLRGYAKSVGISAAGTKGDLLDRLVEAGTTVTQVNEHARAARA